MAGFMSPSILFLSTWDTPERGYLSALLPKLRAAGYKHYHEPAVGGFAMPLVALDAGYDPRSMTTSDVHLFTGILGTLLAGGDFEDLEVRYDDRPIDFSECSTDVDKAALLLYTQYLARIQTKPEGEYWKSLCEDLERNSDYHKASFRDQLARMAGRIGGLAYRSESVWEHMDRIADDPHAVIVSNPPTYPGAYEKFFDTKGLLTWKTPDYDIFEAPTDIPEMVRFMEGRKALLVVQQQQTPRNSASPNPPYARQLSEGQLVYINSNRCDEVVELAGGKTAVPRKMSPRAPRPWPMLPEDYEVRPDSEIRLACVESKYADAYRAEWMHRLSPVPGSNNVLVFIDGYAAGVIGYSLASISSSYSDKWSKHAILRFAFGATHNTLRMTRLATMLSLQHDTLWLTKTPLSTMQIAAAQGLVTVEMTRHPEAKGLRGLMTLDNRQKHPDGFKLVYASDWKKAMTPQEVLAEFLRKEQQWRKSTKRA